mgnify:CR=1 FL=1
MLITWFRPASFQYIENKTSFGALVCPSGTARLQAWQTSERATAGSPLHITA